MRLKALPFLAALAALLLLSAPSAFATDGVILISQATAMHGLPGCASSGFPIVICTPGSYRLSGNVDSGSFLSAISITTGNVTLDLNGFTVSGQYRPVIEAANQNAITVMNGVISGGGGVYFENGGDEVVRGLVIRNSITAGIWLGSGLVIDTVIDNVSKNVDGYYGDGIHVVVGSGQLRIIHCMISGAASYGIFVNGNGLQILDSVVRDSGLSGTYVFGGVVQASRSQFLNNRIGLQFNGGATGFYSANVFSGNTLGDVSGGTSAGDNFCSGSKC